MNRAIVAPEFNHFYIYAAFTLVCHWHFTLRFRFVSVDFAEQKR
jgi:hypothetical protein